MVSQFEQPVYLLWFHPVERLEVLSRLDPDGSHSILTETGWVNAEGPLNPEETIFSLMSWNVEDIRRVLYEFHATQPETETYQAKNILEWMLEYL